jgi:hypothetical protein
MEHSSSIQHLQKGNADMRERDHRGFFFWVRSSCNVKRQKYKSYIDLSRRPPLRQNKHVNGIDPWRAIDEKFR